MRKKMIKTASLVLAVWLFSNQSAFAMHISEGILPMQWAGLWYLVALPFLVKGIWMIKKKSIDLPHFKPLLALMGAMIFVISCMPVPVPTAGTCSHPAGTGISAILIGPIMSIFVTAIALLIQALFMAHGGITTWGADIVSMGVAGSFAAYGVFVLLRKFKAPLFVCGFAAGLLADWATYTVTSFELAAALHGQESFWALFWMIIIAFIPTQLPLGILEGFMTGGMLVFVAQRRPDILSSLQNAFTKKKRSLKKCTQVIIILLSVLWLNSSYVFAQEQGRWVGVDVSIVEKVAAEHGRAAWTPFINTDQGDLLLFVFLLAGVCGGFIMGLCWDRLFSNKKRLVNDKRSIQ